MCLPNFITVRPILCQDISLKTTNANLIVVTEEKSGDHQGHQDASSEDHECVYKPLRCTDRAVPSLEPKMT